MPSVIFGRSRNIRATFAAMPQALRRTMDVADQCSFSLDELRYEYPEELAPAGLSPMEYLRQLTWQGAKLRYPQGPPESVRQLLEHELTLIEELRYEPYFLTVWDLVQFARSRKILCQGRGSAANSAVCYCLGITAVDPERIDMLFERFISRQRNEAPDIDIDFEHERREEVFQYIYEKYGRARAGIAAVTITYRPRSAMRDVGQALGLSQDLVDRLAKNAGYYHVSDDFAQRCLEAGLDMRSGIGQAIRVSRQRDAGLSPASLSTRRRHGHYTRAAGRTRADRKRRHGRADGRPVEQGRPRRTGHSQNRLPRTGNVDRDPQMLRDGRTAFGQGFNARRHPGRRPTVYDMICRADTMGVFQIESRAQMAMLPRLKPRCYYDLVIEVAIIRPGPIQGHMVHPYLRRRQGEEDSDLSQRDIRNVLGKTLGVPLFQEQCMQLAVVAAGFTPGEADQLRRAMGAWRRPGVIDQFRHKLLGGMKRHGLEGEFAEQVFQQIRGFGEYGFPESHAASFALLVYVSAWLKHYYPAEFMRGDPQQPADGLLCARPTRPERSTA